MTSLIQFVNDWNGGECFFEDTKIGRQQAIAHLVKTAKQIRTDGVSEEDRNPHLFLMRVAVGKDSKLLENDQDWSTGNHLNPDLGSSSEGSEEEEEEEE